MGGGFGLSWVVVGSVFCVKFLVLSLDLDGPFRVLDVMGWEGSVVFFGVAGFGEANWPVVGGVVVPLEGRAVEAVVYLVEWVVVDVETVQFG